MSLLLRQARFLEKDGILGKCHVCGLPWLTKLTGADVVVTVGSMRALLSLALAFVIALVGTAIARALDPTVFGSCFEGSCGYAAMLVALLGTLVLAPVLWIGLRRAGPLSQLLLGFMLFALIGHFIMPFELWLAGVAAFVYAIFRLIRRAQAWGRPTRAIFPTPVNGIGTRPNEMVRTSWNRSNFGNVRHVKVSGRSAFYGRGIPGMRSTRAIQQG